MCARPGWPGAAERTHGPWPGAEAADLLRPKWTSERKLHFAFFFLSFWLHIKEENMGTGQAPLNRMGAPWFRLLWTEVALDWADWGRNQS